LLSRHILVLPVVLLALGGCAGDYSPNTYAAAAVQQANKVDRGVIVGRRLVQVSAQGTVGAVTGGAAGGIGGSQAPGGPVASAFGALGGALVGGLVGTATEHAVADTQAWEYVVQQPNGDLLSVTQADPAPLAIGLHVLVITGKQARIVPDYTVALAPPAAEAPATTAKPPKPPAAVPAPVTATPLPPPGVSSPPSPGKPASAGSPVDLPSSP
jgi:outer membrane lipoprotein SlyB